MDRTLEETKNDLRESFLGKGGIHGIGMSRSDRVIRIYTDPHATGQTDLLNEVREAAKPYSVIIVTEDRARIG